MIFINLLPDVQDSLTWDHVGETDENILTVNQISVDASRIGIGVAVVMYHRMGDAYVFQKMEHIIAQVEFF